MIINSKGYGLLKSSLTKEQETELITELTVKPNVNPNYDFGAAESYPVYRYNSERYYVPRYYGIKKYGPPTKINLRPGVDIDTRFKGSLRLDQKEHVNELLDELKEHGAAISNAPTGSGKTVSALYIIAKLKKKTLVIVHKQFLMDQWSERIRQYLPDTTKIGIIQQNDTQVESCDIVIGMLQSISMKEYDNKLFDQFGLVIIDEVHHICAKTFSKALFKITCKYTLGLSATLKRADGLEKVLYWFLGKSIVKTAIDISLETPQVRFVKANYESNIKIKYNFKNKMIIPDLITKLSLDPVRNQQIVEEIITWANTGRKLIVLSERREHCINLKELIELKCSKTVGLYLGSMKQTDLNDSLTKDILIGTYQLVSEGFDHSVLDTIILASSKSSIIQSIGRVMRRKNKNPPLIIDITDKPYLLSQYKTRLKLYTERKYAISYGTEESESEEEPEEEIDASMFRD